MNILISKFKKKWVFFLRGLKYGYKYCFNENFRKRVQNKITTKRRRLKYGSVYFNSRVRFKKRILRNKTHGYCAMCKNTFFKKDLSVDHIISVSNGGSNNKNNLQLLCIKCHRSKDNYKQMYNERYEFKPFKDAFEKIKE